MSLNQYVTLGRSGLRVSPLCLGAMTFGEDLGWGSSVKDSEAILDRYLERGGNFIDTANLYTLGHSEKIIGDYLGRQPSRRDRLVIATKFFTNMFPGDPNGGGASRKSLLAACNESLRRLQSDYIDLYWMHAWGPSHAHRGDAPGARHARDLREGALHRLLGHARLESGTSAGDRAAARMDATGGSSSRILA